MARDVHMCVMQVTLLSNHRDHKLRVDVNLDSTNHLQALSSVFKYANTWDEALEFAHKHADKHKVPLKFSLWTRTNRCEVLPIHQEFARFKALTRLALDHYTRLEHIDVRPLAFLRRFEWYPPVELNGKGLASVRITGLAQCKYLENMVLLGMCNVPFVLKLKAPFRNLQALQEVEVGLRCVNQRYPLELATSQSLSLFEYNNKRMTRRIKALRNLAVCVCLAIRGLKLGLNANIAFTRAMLRGPIHDPSLIVKVGHVIQRLE